MVTPDAVSSDAKLVALRRADAQALREELLSLSHATQSSPVTPAPSNSATTTATTAATRPGAATPAEVQADERVLFRVNTGRLVLGLVLSITGLMFAIIIAAIVVIAVLVHSPAANAYYLPFLVGVIIGVWRQFNGQYGTTVALAPDGLRLRSGLVQTTAETIQQLQAFYDDLYSINAIEHAAKASDFWAVEP